MMKRGVRGLAAGLALSPLLALSAQNAPAQIAAAERTTLEEQACRSRHGVGIGTIDARAYGAGENAPAIAEVHCASHDVFMGNPIHYVVQCSRTRAQWACQGEWNEILVTVDAEQIPVRIEGEIPVGVSYQTIQKIASSGTFQGYSLRKALVPPCYVNKGSAQEFIDVKCEGWHIVVSMWCPQSDCPRVFSMTKLGS